MIDYSLYYYSNLCSNGNRIWYISQPESLLMEIDVLSKVMRCIGKIPKTKNQFYEYRFIYFENNELFVFPYEAYYIYRYCLINEEWSEIRMFGKAYPEICAGIKCGRVLYLYGTTSIIYIFDISTNRISFIDTSCYLRKNIHPGIMYAYSFDSFCSNDTVYFPLVNSNVILTLNSREKVNHVIIGNKVIKQKGIFAKCFEGNIQMICLDDQNRIKVISSSLDGLIIDEHIHELDNKTINSNTGMLYTWAEYVNGKWLLLLNDFNNIAFIIDKDQIKTIEECKHNLENSLYRQFCPHGVFLNTGKIYTISVTNGSLIVVDCYNQRIDEYKIEVNSNKICAGKYRDLSNRKILSETNRMATLSNFILAVNQGGVNPDIWNSIDKFI